MDLIGLTTNISTFQTKGVHVASAITFALIKVAVLKETTKLQLPTQLGCSGNVLPDEELCIFDILLAN